MGSFKQVGEELTTEGTETTEEKQCRQNHGQQNHFSWNSLWRLSMTAGVPARYTPDSANSAWEVFFKFDELFQFLAAHTNAS